MFDDVLRRQAQCRGVTADEVEERGVDGRVAHRLASVVPPAVMLTGSPPGLVQGPITPMIRSTQRCITATAASSRSSTGRSCRCPAVTPRQSSSVEHRCGAGLDELVLGAEGAEHGALGDAGGLGHLLRRHADAVLAQQRDGRLDERGTAVLDAEGGRRVGSATVSE